ncbi:hypothetical protein pkur_cds_621 [Pandoravirus kuranda]|uniref:DUF5900 domain-containing protein n=1 Tax=Pandoravirus kuranda TaxID=3019033 RepID=A0AA95EDG3_9VIRU|nr:hypothetical protein pkur_cds_621 [Pandoravirus kuranda]
MRMRRRSDLGDRAPLVKDMPTADGDDHDTHVRRIQAWYGRLRQCWRRSPGRTRRQVDDVARCDRNDKQDDIDAAAKGRCDAFAGGDVMEPRRAMDPARWRRAYAAVYGVDSESGDPMDHATLRRIGASWRFMWACRQPIAKVPAMPGAVVHGEWALPNGDLVRGAFCVCPLRVVSERDGSTSGPTLSCARVVCPISASAQFADDGDDHHDNSFSKDTVTADDDRRDADRDINRHSGDGNDDHGYVTAFRDVDGCVGRDEDHGDGTHHSSVSPRLPTRGKKCKEGGMHDKASNGALGDGDNEAHCAQPTTSLALVPHGYAAAIGIDGSLIEGSFCMGLLDGHGRTVDARGEIFGQWRRGRLHGRAVAVTQDGWFVCATWNNGRLVGDYFAHAAHGEQFRCKACPDGRFDGRCRRGYPGGDWAIEQWSDGALVGIESFRIAPVADSDGLAEGAVLDDCEWTCDRVRGGDAGVRYDGHIYYPSDPTTRAFALFYDYMASEASTRAFTDQQRDAFVWAMWMARRRHAAGLPT